MADDLITLAQAGQLFREVIGRRKSLKVLAEEIRARPHLAVFGVADESNPRLLGVRRDRWRYFLQARRSLYGAGAVFCGTGDFE